MPIPVKPKLYVKTKTKDIFDIKIKTSKAQYDNDINWLRLGNPEAFLKRDMEFIREFRKRVMKKQEIAKRMHLLKIL